MKHNVKTVVKAVAVFEATKILFEHASISNVSLRMLLLPATCLLLKESELEIEQY